MVEEDIMLRIGRIILLVGAALAARRDDSESTRASTAFLTAVIISTLIRPFLTVVAIAGLFGVFMITDGQLHWPGGDSDTGGAAGGGPGEEVVGEGSGTDEGSDESSKTLRSSQLCATPSVKHPCADAPLDVPPGSGQYEHDIFSWQSFVALNWPQTKEGNDEPIVARDGSIERVWEGWITAEEVFLPDGSVPPKAIQPEACENLLNTGAPGITMTSSSKVSEQLSARGDLEATVDRPLVDQSLNFVVAEIRMNDTEFDFILKHKLYDAAIQAMWSGPVQMPPVGNKQGDDQGAVEIKASWRLLTSKRDRALQSRYITRTAQIYVSPDDTESESAACHKVMLGLIGFHIAHKTRNAPEWIWSTFEQVDTVTKGPGLPDGYGPFLTRLDCTDPQTCPPNQPPPTPSTGVGGYVWSAFPPYAQRYPATQVVRTTPITEETRNLNKAWHDAIVRDGPKSIQVLQHYEVISTQWPMRPGESDPHALKFGDPRPVPLANTTMETYMQPSSNCMQCHGSRSHLAGGNDKSFSDFSFLLQHACFDFGHPQTQIDMPCAQLVVGTYSELGISGAPVSGPVAGLNVNNVRVSAGDTLRTRPVMIGPSAGSFELTCAVGAQGSASAKGGPTANAAETSADVEIVAVGGYSFFGGPQPDRVRSLSQVPLQLQLSAGDTEEAQLAAFEIKNSSTYDLDISCVLQPK